MIYEVVILNWLSLLIISGDSQYQELAPSQYQELDPGLYLLVLYQRGLLDKFQYCDSNI